MKKKILVTVRQFMSGLGMLDVDSRLFDGDTKNPITIKHTNHQGHEYDFHLGQISSSLLWAVQDIPAQDRTAKQELDKMYPGGYEFEFYYMPVYFVNEESKKWWEEMPQPLREKVMIEHSIKMLHQDGEELPEEELERAKKIIKKIKPTKQEIQEFWQDRAMIHIVTRMLKPVDLNNVIY
jgi:hypothetical protein